MSSIRLGHRIDTLRPSLTNGPGWRVSMWTQGCSLLCTQKCLNPHLLTPRGGFEFSAGDVADAIEQISKRFPDLEGVTVLGGEPFDQAESVAEILEPLHGIGLSTMVYTGHLYEELSSSPAASVQRLLSAVDVLADGPFVESMYDGGIAWRGSSNQRLICLSSRYSPEALETRYQSQGKSYSIRREANGRISISGLQERASAARVESLLRKASRMAGQDKDLEK
jgi:anaerobic ribonucleoside-triphosphate reductase activating protein